MSATSLPPGPRRPPAAQTFRWIFRPIALMEENARRFGDVFTMRLAQVGTFVLISDPADHKRVFTASGDVLRAGASNIVLEPVLGPRSVLLLDGAEHLRQRKLMLPSFHGTRMAAYGDLMAEIAEDALARWPSGRELSLHPLFQDVTLEIILRAVFGVRERARLEELRDALVATVDRATRTFALMPWLRRDLGPGSPWRRFLRARQRADGLLYSEIARRRAATDLEDRDDVLSLLLQARDEDGNGLSDSELRDELMTLLLAGHETTATSLAWAVERLLRRPDALERLQAEARGEDGDGTEYADATVRETLRRRPPIPIVGWQVVGHFELRGHVIPPGVGIAPCIYLTHHREDLYPEPYEFRPERFLGVTPDTYGWLPFGGGIRRCLGASFALFEMRVVLQSVVRALDLAPVSADPELVARRAIILAPRHGARAVLKRVKPRVVTTSPA